MKQAVIDLIQKLLADVQALPEDDKDAQIAALTAQLAEIQAKLDADEAKIVKAKEDLA